MKTTAFSETNSKQNERDHLDQLYPVLGERKEKLEAMERLKLDAFEFIAKTTDLSKR